MNNNYSDPVLAGLDDSTNEENLNLFKIMPVNKYLEQAKLRPIPKMLFSEFWYENEICFLFADTNLGKSLLSVQIGNSISRGQNIPGFKMEAQRQRVLYYDFELSDKQFQIRYSDKDQNLYSFDNFFLRAEMNPYSEIPPSFQDFESYLIQSIEQNIIEQKTKVIIIDNITYLKNETEKAKNALPLMKELKRLKEKYQLSILVLAHSPKRDQTKPLSRNDLAGSKMLMNFCDSSFAIGESIKDNNLRYLKQIKARNTENLYNSENVCLCRIEKLDKFLGFHFFDFDSEYEHLRTISKKDKEELEKNIIELKQTEPNLSLRQIAKKYNTSHQTVKRTLDKQNL